ncbi:MAG: hypothetical protein AAB316_15905 [Bacteroidota bacterium]
MKLPFQIQTLLFAIALIFSCKNDPAESNATAAAPSADSTSAAPATQLAPGARLPVSGKVTAINSQFVGLEGGEKVNLPAAGNDSATTIFLVRHAEIVGEKTSLSPAGQARSGYLANLMQGAGIFIIYVSDNASVQTGLASAKACQSEFSTFSISKPEDEQTFLKTALKNYPGKRVLVVSTAEVIPNLVNQLAGKTVAEPITAGEFDNLFVAIGKELGSAEVKRLKY